MVAELAAPIYHSAVLCTLQSGSSWFMSARFAMSILTTLVDEPIAAPWHREKGEQVADGAKSEWRRKNCDE